MKKMMFVSTILLCMFSIPLQASQDNGVFVGIIFVASLFGYNHYNHVKKCSQLRQDDEKNNNLKLQLLKSDSVNSDFTASCTTINSRTTTVSSQSLGSISPDLVSNCENNKVNLQDDSQFTDDHLEQSYCIIPRDKE